MRWAASSSAADTLLIDHAVSMNRVLALRSRRRHWSTVEAGIEWPALIAQLARPAAAVAADSGASRQKQTGADRLTIGGALSRQRARARADASRRSSATSSRSTLVDATGELAALQPRRRTAELFPLAIGGYGLFGVITTVTLRLAPRRKVERLVEIATVEGLDATPSSGASRTGSLYGDFQFAIDPDRRRVPAPRRLLVLPARSPSDTPIAEGQKELSAEDWRDLLQLAHTDKQRGVRALRARTTWPPSGQVYWSDTASARAPISTATTATLDTALGAARRAREMITEMYVPRAGARRVLRRRAPRPSRRTSVPIDLRHGPPHRARRPRAFLRLGARAVGVHHLQPARRAHAGRASSSAADAFRALIDLALRRGGSYFLTYHRWATPRAGRGVPTRSSSSSCGSSWSTIPQERFQSEWYRHYRAMFADRLRG